MALPNVMQTGRSGMMASKTAIATTGHNITNANTEGYNRQRVQFEADKPMNSVGSKAMVGRGVLVSRVDRINDEYIEKQIRNAGRDMAHLEEKEIVLKQTEDVFNEMNGEGMNRLMASFFNEFRKLSNDPNSEAIRQSVREAANAVVNDFHRLRNSVDEVRRHIDSRIENHVREVNALAETIKDMNIRIKAIEIGGANPNDLKDQRDQALRKLGSYMDLAMHQDNEGNYVIDVKGMGPLVAGPSVEKFSVFRSPADAEGKPENALDVKSTSSANSVVTHRVKGGKLGALLEARDRTLSTVLSRLDELAYSVGESINSIHEMGFSRHGVQGIKFFKPLEGKERAAELLQLSDAIQANVNNIAAAAQPDSPGDNRIATAIAGLQHMRLLNEGQATADDFYNSIVADVGVATAGNRSGMNQTRDIMTQLNKMRDQISGVSIDEETTNLLQYQQSFDASAKVIQIADEMLKTVLELKR